MSSIRAQKIPEHLLIIVDFLRTQPLNYASLRTFPLRSSENFERRIFILIFYNHRVARVLILL